MNKSLHFDQLNETYSNFVCADPIRNELHYPSMVASMSDLAGADVLDMGCGDGTFAKLLAREHQAKVVGFDISPSLIEIARNCEERDPLGISYETSDACDFSLPDKFDYVTAVMVLPYSIGTAALEQFFSCAGKHLKMTGSLCAIVFNPSFSAFGQVIANRRFNKLDDSMVQVEFLNVSDQKTAFTSQLTQYSKFQYTKAANNAGFGTVRWHELLPGQSSQEMNFWSRCIELQPYALLLCRT